MKKEVQFPNAYSWLIENEIVGFTSFTQLQPWYFLKKEDMFWVHEKWPDSGLSNLLVFARRQDNDDFSCFSIKDGSVTSVLLIHGWVKGGIEVLESYSDMWNWLHMVLDDIKEWVDIEQE